MNKIKLTDARLSDSVVITLRKAGFAAYAETDGADNFVVTDATLSQAVVAYGNSIWVTLR